MATEVIMTGKTVDEALERARAELGADAEKTDFEILQMPRKGFLGFHKTPAKVRVFVKKEEKPVMEPEAKKAVSKEVRKPQPAPPRPVKDPKPVAKEIPETRVAAPAVLQDQKIEKPPVKTAAAVLGKPAVGKESAVRKKPVQTKEKVPQVAKPATKRPIQEVLEAKGGTANPSAEEGIQNEKTKAAEEYVKALLKCMDVTGAEVTARQYPENLEVRMEGDGLGVIIGRRGETLDAVQYLTSLVVNRAEGEYVRVTLDSGNYRKKRAETLERLASKLARNAVRTGRPQKLEPMNPYERRIIHAAVARVEGATSSSMGEEPNRRVVIAAKDAETRRPEPVREKAPRGDGKRPPRDRDHARGPRSAAPGRKPPFPRTERASAMTKISDAEIEIPEELLPKDLPEPPQKKVSAPTEPRTPSAEEKDILPLYGRIDI